MFHGPETQLTVSFELLLGEELIRGRLVRKARMGTSITQYVLGQTAEERRLDQNNFALLIRVAILDRAANER